MLEDTLKAAYEELQKRASPNGLRVQNRFSDRVGNATETNATDTARPNAYAAIVIELCWATSLSCERT